MKILYPHGEVTQDELAELLEFALEGRRRVKEQLKKMGSFEYYQTSFSYTLTGDRRREVRRGARAGRARPHLVGPARSRLGLHRAWSPRTARSGCTGSEVSVARAGTGKLKIGGRRRGAP